MPSELELLLRATLAAVLGGAVGYDRAVRRKPAGVRTHMLVAAGAALFVAASILIIGDATAADARGDTMRVPAAIVTGVGFLGAGAIMRAGSRVIGLTTAAGIWAVAAIGVLAGSGFILLAIGATALVLAIVNVLSWLDLRSLRDEDDEG